ncbi:hypothetical protein D9C01_13020, partial [Corynebacterium diphtheriae]
VHRQEQHRRGEIADRQDRATADPIRQGPPERQGPHRAAPTPTSGIWLGKSSGSAVGHDRQHRTEQDEHDGGGQEQGQEAEAHQGVHRQEQHRRGEIADRQDRATADPIRQGPPERQG